MAAIEKFVQAVCRLVMVIAGIVLIVMMLHIVADVTAKYAFHKPIIGTIEIVAWYYMVIVAMAPVAYVQIYRQHLMVELFTMKLSIRATAVLDACVALVSASYTGLLAWLVLHEALRATHRGRAQDLTWFDLPTWPSAWVMPVSFTLLTLVFLLQAVSDFGRAARGEALPAAPAAI